MIGIKLAAMLPAVVLAGSGATSEDTMVSFLNWGSNLKIKMETWNEPAQQDL